jgi:hypothetical protein
MPISSKKLLILTTLLFTSNIALAVAPPSTSSFTRNYNLLNVQNVVSNSMQCANINGSLQALAKHPIQLQFMNEAKAAHLQVSDLAGALAKHHFIIVEQNVTDHSVNRTGIGRFMLNKQSIDYVIKASGDINQANFKYLYPVIFSGDNGHCFYTAILQPSAETIASFKKNIAQGLVANKTDLPIK